MVTVQDRQETEQEATRHWLAGLLAQRRLGFFNRLAARVEMRLGRWNAYWATLSRRGRRAAARRLAPALLGASLLAGLMASAAPVGASAITVADGEVGIEPNGICSLVEAIENANGTGSHGDCASGTAGTDTVILPPNGDFPTYGRYFNLNGHSAIPAITSGIVIEGNGSTIRRNPGTSPARLFMVYDDANLTLNEVTLSGGHAAEATGGAIYVVDQPPFGGGHVHSLTVTNSTVTGNYAYYGGAISFRGSNFTATPSTLTIENTTISNNYGPGVLFSGFHDTIDVTITDSTITGNGQGIYGDISETYGGSLTISRNIISGNTNGEVGVYAYATTTTLVSNDNVFGDSSHSNANAFEDFSPSGTDVTATSDGTDPTPLAGILSPLADNGGPTMTHALPTGSPAIDLATGGPATDQRGEPRPAGAGFDAGAYEAQPPDDDDDGIPNGVEDGAPNGGDGNDDGTPDSDQPNVASLPDSASGDYVTLAAPAGTELADVQAIDNPSPGDAPAGVTFPIGFLDFEVRGVTPGGAVVVTLFLHGGQTVDTYYKYGPTPANPADHWYQFHDNGTTGAEFLSDRVLLHLVDGGRGDSDLAADGVIVDPGAPGVGGSSAGPALYISGSAGSAGAISFDARDILAFDTGAESWALHFDGSDVGITKKLSAFSILEDGSIVMSFHAKQPGLPGLSGDALPHDLVRFVPTSLGPTTAGAFEWYLDGSDVGLTTSSERIDALDILEDDRVLISTSGNVAVDGLPAAQNEDLIALTPTSLGATTAGAWALYFDGTAVAGLPKEDLSGVHVDEAGGDLYLVFDGAFKINALRGNSKEVVKLSPAGGGTIATRFWSGPDHGFNGKISGLEMD